ncbi:MAG: twin-arginine translocase subunit TatC [Anaerolineae bacterium]|nr:twin-arginine translocase subunit TatC [Anaerolineae bacterium]
MTSPAPPAAGDPDDAQLRMSILGHLDELRRRLVRAAIAFVIAAIAGFIVAGPVLEFLKQPYGTNQFITLGPTDSVVAYFRVALMIGGILAIPVITYQALMFIVPGLTARERRYVLYSIPFVTLLFVVGVVFAWAMLIPPAIGFFNNFMPELFVAQWTADRYLSFVTALLFWMGVAFETPLIAFVLSILGILTPFLLIRHWRIAIIGAAIAAALITPTVDPVNMMLVMGPLMALYALSIVLTVVGMRFAPNTREVTTT